MQQRARVAHSRPAAVGGGGASPRPLPWRLPPPPPSPAGRRPQLLRRQGRSSAAAAAAAASTGTGPRVVWVETHDQGVLTAAVESGFSQALFSPATAPLAAAWSKLAAFEALQLQPEGGAILDAKGEQVGRLLRVSSKADMAAAVEAAQTPGFAVMDATDWKVIPAENLVAAFQPGPGRLLGVASSAAEARVMLEALEAGTAGVLLRTEDAAQVRELAAYLARREAEGAGQFDYEAAEVTSVSPVGMCDRVCVDLCSLLKPGEGMLVGSFARALFLVHSECLESQYISSRPFRVNAGAVHAYAQAPGGRTAYLSELSSGAEVLVADAAGRARTAVVGRCKIEARPMMLVEAQTADGARHSTLLQNAETVRLVGPTGDGGAPARADGSAGGGGGGGGGAAGWRAVSVSELRPGAQVFVLRQAGARHTGISIQESINEK